MFMIPVMVKQCLETRFCPVCFGVSQAAGGGWISRAGAASWQSGEGVPEPPRWRWHGASPSGRAGLQQQAGSFPRAIMKEDACLGAGTGAMLLRHPESHLCDRRKRCLGFPSISPISSHLPTVQIQLLTLLGRHGKSRPDLSGQPLLLPPPGLGAQPEHAAIPCLSLPWLLLPGDLSSRV